VEFTTTSFSEFGATSSAAAPVVLTSFTALAQGPTNFLEWSVDSEIDFSHYVVERSTDGVTFQKLGQVVGTNSDRYSLVDVAPAAQQYYRLKMVDYDGSFEYSKVVSVRRGSNNGILEAFPVPTSGNATVRFSSTAGRVVTARLTDALGRQVKQLHITTQGSTTEFTVDMTSLPPATYQLTLVDGRETRNVRLVRR
jgi:hypothetical protein